MNGIAVQKAFIGPPESKPSVNVPRTKRRSIETTNHPLPVYITGSKPDTPIKTPVEEPPDRILILIKNKTGSKTEPCGATILTSAREILCPSIFSYCFPLER